MLGKISNNKAIATFQNSLNTRRCLKFKAKSTYLQEANNLFSMVTARSEILVPLLTVGSGGKLNPSDELEQIRELRQYLGILDDYIPLRNIENPSESTLDVLFVSKIVDPCFIFNTHILHCNQNFPYLLNFVCENVNCHTTPRLDISFFNTFNSQHPLSLLPKVTISIH